MNEHLRVDRWQLRSHDFCQDAILEERINEYYVNMAINYKQDGPHKRRKIRPVRLLEGYRKY